MQTIDLPCPECNEVNALPLTELVNGREMPCQHCGAIVMLTCYRERADDPPLWHMESSSIFDDEKRSA